MFVAAGVKTFKAVLINLMYKFIRRLDDSENEIMFLSNIKFSTTRSCGDTGTAVYILSMCSSLFFYLWFCLYFILSGP